MACIEIAFYFYYFLLLGLLVLAPLPELFTENTVLIQMMLKADNSGS
jgi:hypothetical protein